MIKRRSLFGFFAACAVAPVALRAIEDNSHIHTVEDGRGHRDVYVDGVEVPWVVYADTRLGYVEYIVQPMRMKPDGSDVVRGRMHGHVTVVPKLQTRV